LQEAWGSKRKARSQQPDLAALGQAATATSMRTDFGL
jgi:hypothetical protein